MTLTFDLSTSKKGSRVACAMGFLPANFRSRLGVSHGTDRRTDRQTEGQTDDGHQRIMPPDDGWGMIICNGVFLRFYD